MKKTRLLIMLLIVIGGTSAIDFQIGAGNVRWAMNCDFYGRDIKNFRVPGEQCGELCVNNGQCSHFSWNNGVCYLKNFPDSPGAAALGGGVCGWVIGSSVHWAMGCYFDARIIGYSAIPGEKCGGQCVSNSQCNYFTWYEGFCFVQNFAGVPVPTTLNGGVCGWVVR